MKITEEEQNRLLERLRTEILLPEFDPATMVSARTLADATRLSERRAAYILKDRVRKGELEEISVRLESGNRGVAYVERS